MTHITIEKEKLEQILDTLINFDKVMKRSPDTDKAIHTLVQAFDERERFGDLDRKSAEELNCAEDLIDSLSVNLDMEKTDFDCIGEYIAAVFEAWQTSVYGSDRHHKAMLVAMTNMGQAIAEAEIREHLSLIHI